MKSMKVNSKMKNRMNQEFQQFVESRLIEVMILKIPWIQFGSILNLFQMRLQTAKTEHEHESSPKPKLIQESRAHVLILHQSHNERTLTFYPASQ
jgi:hypothetical protein